MVLIHALYLGVKELLKCLFVIKIVKSSVKKLALRSNSRQLLAIATLCIQPTIFSCCSNGCPQREKRTLAPPWEIECLTLSVRAKISRKRKVSSLIPIISFNSCNDSIFAGMTLTLHKSQVHCSVVMQCWA